MPPRGCRLRPVLPDPGVGRGGGGDQLGGGEAGPVLGAAAGLRQGAAAAAREGRHVQRGRVRGQVAQHGRGRGQPGHGHVARGVSVVGVATVRSSGPSLYQAPPPPPPPPSARPRAWPAAARGRCRGWPRDCGGQSAAAPRPRPHSAEAAARWPHSHSLLRTLSFSPECLSMTQRPS